MVRKEVIATDEEVETYKEYASRYKDFYELHKQWEQELLAQEEAKRKEEEAINALVLALRQADSYPLSNSFLAEVANVIERLLAHINDLENEVE